MKSITQFFTIIGVATVALSYGALFLLAMPFLLAIEDQQ
jgi:hypothetical protein